MGEMPKSRRLCMVMGILLFNTAPAVCIVQVHVASEMAAESEASDFSSNGSVIFLCVALCAWGKKCSANRSAVHAGWHQQ